jgi:hypothetical protein
MVMSAVVLLPRGMENELGFRLTVNVTVDGCTLRVNTTVRAPTPLTAP